MPLDCGANRSSRKTAIAVLQQYQGLLEGAHELHALYHNRLIQYIIFSFIASHTLTRVAAAPRQCQARNLPADNIFCKVCTVIQPATPSPDFFALMGLPRAFDLEPRRLEAAFKALQRSLHPDKYSTAEQARGGRAAR